MSRVRLGALVIALAALLALPAMASASPQSQMLDRVNAVRAHHGLQPLRFSSSLAHSAHRYSAHMMRAGYFGHASRIHASRRFRTLGEIIEMHRRYRPSVGATLRSWMHSPPHRSIILSGGFRFAGAGFTEGRFHGRRTTIWVMHFGRH